MNQKPSAAPVVLSGITFGISALAAVCAALLLFLTVFGTGSGGPATALTNQAVFFVTAVVLLTGAVWLFSVLGGLAGLIMTIADIALRRFSILWMPIVAVVLSIACFIVSFLVF